MLENSGWHVVIKWEDNKDEEISPNEPVYN